MDIMNIIIIIGGFLILASIILIWAKKENGVLEIGHIKLRTRQVGLFYLIAGIAIIISAIGINITIKMKFAQYKKKNQEIKYELANAKMQVEELEASLETLKTLMIPSIKRKSRTY